MRSKKSDIPESPKAGLPKLSLPIKPPYAPMEARQAKDIPTGKQYIYEPKWGVAREAIERGDAGEDVVF